MVNVQCYIWNKTSIKLICIT